MLENLKEQIKDKPYYKSIVDGLEHLTESDTELADVLKNTDRKLDECWSYIRNKAKKQEKDGCACIEDHIVYGWAAEFYKMAQEDYDKLKKPVQKPKAEKKEETNEEVKPEPKKEIKAPDRDVAQKKPKAEKKEPSDDNLEGQMNIFDILGA